MTDNHDFPAVLLLGRIDRANERIVAFQDNRILQDEDEVNARAAMYGALEGNGALVYRLMLAPVANADEALADFRAEMAYEAGWGPAPETKDEPEDDPTPSGPQPPEETDQDQYTTNGPAGQAVAVLIVAYEGIPPWPAVTKATGDLLGFNAHGLTRAHSTAETRLLLTAEGYRPDFTRWQVLDRGGETVRRSEVWVRAGQPEPEPTLPELADRAGVRAEPITDEHRERLQALAQERAAAEGRELPAFGESAQDWHRQNSQRLNRYGGAVRI